MTLSPYEPIRSWDKIFTCIDLIVDDPAGNTELIKALTINLRVETGSLPGYRGSGFAEKADSVALSEQMRQKLEALMEMDLTGDGMYLLVRQLVKSLPFFGASKDEIRAIRGLAEEIDYAFPSPITEDIRGEIHGKLSPRNLDLVRALLSYIERGDTEPLQHLNKYQKVFQYPPERFADITGLLRELEHELTKVFEPHPGKIEDRIEDIYQLLRNMSQIVSSQINDYLRYFTDSIEKNNPSLIRTNLDILRSLIRDAIESEDSPDLKLLFRDLEVKMQGVEGFPLERVESFITEWRRHVVSLFFPSLSDTLEIFVEYLRARDSLQATLMLGDMRMLLKSKIVDPKLPAPVRLEAVWLDLTFERIGYILFGEVTNVVLADITIEALPTIIDVIHSMVLNVCAKGQGTREFEKYSRELVALKRWPELNFYTVYSIVERMNAEIGAITDKVAETYYDMTRRIFVLREIPNAEQASSAFVDGLFRETTLQHLSELTLELLNFSRTRIADLLGRVRHPPIREISTEKVARIKRDLDRITTGGDPSKLAYSFRSGAAEGGIAEYPLLGEKGANLAEMAKLGVNVPPGFTLTSMVCSRFFADGHALCKDTRRLIDERLAELEEITGHALGSAGRPLLLAVRAGSCVSMPGMMDTILNVGLNDETVEALARITGNPLFAYECYLRLISKYCSAVMGFAPDEDSTACRIELPECSVDELRKQCENSLKAVARATGRHFPQDAREQLLGAVGAIFSSWQSDSAITYRQIFNIPRRFYTAATIQQMVFGNLGKDSCSGVAFSRNPITGEKQLFGEFLPSSQGEVLVCGRGTPLPLTAGQDDSDPAVSFENRFPRLYEDLKESAATLERCLSDMQDIEFTVERGTLYLLQTRPAKRTDSAALKIAIDLAEEGVIERQTAVSRLGEAGLKQLFLPTFDPSEAKHLVARGNPASPGVATGKLAFSRTDAIMRTQAGEEIIFIANQTTPEDIGGIAASKGVLTREGGMTSHAAINSRRMAKPCVTGCSALEIDRDARALRVQSMKLGPDDIISIDGYTGEVFLGEIEIVEPGDIIEDADSDISRYYLTYLGWREETSESDAEQPERKTQTAP